MTREQKKFATLGMVDALAEEAGAACGKLERKIVDAEARLRSYITALETRMDNFEGKSKPRVRVSARSKPIP